MMKSIEDLLDAADQLARRLNHGSQRPNFQIPQELALLAQQTPVWLEYTETHERGKGWFARQSIPAGTIVMVAKPLAMVMLSEEDNGHNNDGEMEEDEKAEMDDCTESALNSLLVLKVLKELKQNPKLWTSSTLSHLYPRDHADIERLPIRKCQDSQISEQISSLLAELQNHPELRGAKDFSRRIALIVRYNVLSVETCPELLSHPGPSGHSNLSGAGLYLEPSFFNHNSRPNISRWAIGDVMCFVANQDIAIGAEACISYIEHDILCESIYRRNLNLEMDFEDAPVEGENVDNAMAREEDGPNVPVVDTELQNELMEMNPFDRLESIEQLLQQARVISSPDDADMPMESNEATVATGWFQCDEQNLNIIKAITLDGLGQTAQASRVWEECISFTESKLPPLDEASVVVRIQAALCWMHLGDEGSVQRARDHAMRALFIHDKLFGGGVARLRRRYKGDFGLCLRRGTSNANVQAGAPNVVDLLWPVTG
jgi:SET domain